jgi:DNA-binding NarL/FixJ family response regulator
MSSDKAPGGRALRVVVADDDSFTASLVAGGLEARGMRVTTAATVEEAWRLIGTENPHALVTDLDFGHGESGASLLNRVYRQCPWVGLVVLTSHRSPQVAVGDICGIPANAVYLVKSSLRRVEELANAVHCSIAGEVPDRVSSAHDREAISLTAAQAEVLRMLANGSSTRALAEQRGTTVRAAETMLARLYAALGLESDDRSNQRVEAVKLWQQGHIVVR